jgi:serine/threonine protein kinase HipA of HipAB toxin-antitoxin module
LSAHFHDYDWADEVLHAQIGRRVLKREGISSDEAREHAKTIHEKTWAALDQYRDRDQQQDWWPGFVRRVLDHESAATNRPELNIFSE